MTEYKRFTVKPQNDLFGVNDNTAEYNVVNGIPTKIEAEWLCDTLNSLHEENERVKSEYKVLHTQFQDLKKFLENNLNEYWTREKLNEKIIKLSDENDELRQENKKILDTINNKITEKGMNWYGAEDNSKEEKEANLQLNVLEEIRDELKVIFESN